MIRDIGSRLLREDAGATTVEYGLMIALIAGAVITVGVGLSNAIQDKFSEMAASFR